MKTKMKQDLKNNDLVELRKKLADSRKSLSDAMLDHRQFKLKNTSSLTVLRKEIAVMLTLIKEKEMQNGKDA